MKTTRKNRQILLGTKTLYLSSTYVGLKYRRKTKQADTMTHMDYSNMVKEIGEFIGKGLLEGRIWQLPKAWGILMIRQKKYNRNHKGYTMAWGDNKKHNRQYGEYHYFDGSLDPIARIFWSFADVKHENAQLYCFRASKAIKTPLHIRLRVHKQTYIRLY
jgi:hypothetical protein